MLEVQPVQCVHDFQCCYAMRRWTFVACQTYYVHWFTALSRARFQNRANAGVCVCKRVRMRMCTFCDALWSKRDKLMWTNGDSTIYLVCARVYVCTNTYNGVHRMHFLKVRRILWRFSESAALYYYCYLYTHVLQKINNISAKKVKKFVKIKEKPHIHATIRPF